MSKAYKDFQWTNTGQSEQKIKMIVIGYISSSKKKKSMTSH